MFDQAKKPITSIDWASLNKKATFGAFLDLYKINTIVEKHNLDFDNRIVALPNGLVRIQGLLKPSIVPAISFHDKRKNLIIQQPHSRTLLSSSLRIKRSLKTI
jgi:hypothetical protein